MAQAVIREEATALVPPAIVAFVLLALSLVACGGDNLALCDGCGTATPTPTPTSTAPTPIPSATPALVA
jgi:hypothetical protein